MKYVAPTEGTIKLTEEERELFNKASELIKEILAYMPDYSSLEIKNEDWLTWERLSDTSEALYTLGNFCIPWAITNN